MPRIHLGLSIWFCVAPFAGVLGLASCAGMGGGGGTVMGNENGSEPVNESEALEYQKAVVRCHKTGGTRVVKVEGRLRCY